jgi:hypothetical protein
VKLSASGKEFIQEYTLGAVLSEQVVRALYGEGFGNIKQVVIDSAPLLLWNWAQGTYSVKPELNSAIEYAISYLKDVQSGRFVVPKMDRKDGSADDKLAHNLEAFKKWALQGDLYQDRRPTVKKLAGALVYSAPLFKSYLKKLNTVTESAARADRESAEAGNDGLFGDTSPDRDALLEKAMSVYNKKMMILNAVVLGSSSIDPDWARAASRWDRKMRIMSSVIMGDGMGVISSGIMDMLGVDLKSRVLKFMSASENNEKAFRKALSLHRDVYGAPGKKDIGKILKVAQKMVKDGKLYNSGEYKKASEGMAGGGNAGSGGAGFGRSGREGLGGNSNAVIDMFNKIKKMYDSGEVSREQLSKAFNVVVGESAFASFRRRVSSGVRFGPLTVEQRSRCSAGFRVGSRVRYVSLSSGASSCGEGVIRSIGSELYQVEMDDGHGVSAYGEELSPVFDDAVLSSKGKWPDPMRQLVLDFLKNISTLQKVPDDEMKIDKQILAPDHVCYVYTETVANGKPYTVEFHATPFEPFCDVYVVRDFDNFPLDGDGLHISDFEDWNLGEVDIVDGWFTDELARSGGGRAHFEDPFRRKEHDEAVRKQYKYAPFAAPRAAPAQQMELFGSFGGWYSHVGSVVSGGGALSMHDVYILSRLVI